MSRLIPGNQKHLTLDDRFYIEKSLDQGLSFLDISKYLCKDPSTISKEIQLNRIPHGWNRGSFDNPYNFCVHRFDCRKKNACKKVIVCDRFCRSCSKCNSVCSCFEREKCRRLNRAPYVCNGCPKSRNRCQISSKYDYNAKAAQRKYEERRSESRAGVNMTKSQMEKMNQIICPLIEQGQSPYMILTNHPELGISVKTLYRYIDMELFDSRNIDLKRKTKFKPRKCHKSQIVNREVFQGRTYEDFLKLDLPLSDFREMDTVVSAQGSYKCILTLYFPDTELFLAYLIHRKTPGAVKAIFERLQGSLGGAYEFQSLFPVILTDRGVEFGDPVHLETDPSGMQRTSIYYCDPMRSNQKAGIENVHTMLRMILPKGTVFEFLTQWHIRKAVNHINSAPRAALDGDTPYHLALKKYGPEILEALQLKEIPADQVTLSPALLK
jgi:IS30 family transposase